MRIKAGIFAAVAALLTSGLIAQAQDRDRASESPKKADSPGKKPPGPARPTGAKPTAPPASNATTGEAEEKSIRASAESFTKFYNAHDASGLAALFTPKAEMIDEDGLVTRGREAIEEAFSDVFQQSPDATMQVDVESVRVLTPNLAIEEGIARSAKSPEDAEDVTTYVAIHVKADGIWQLACVRDWDAAPAELTPHDHLQELSWLIGDWVEESPDSVVRTSCNWHDNGNFLMQEFDVHISGQIAMSGTVRIGWDAVARQFRSWVFDSHGGHSEGLWLRDGDEWTIKTQGATAAGETASSTNVYRYVDEDTITWRSFDRVIDGQRSDDIEEFIVKRRAPDPEE